MDYENLSCQKEVSLCKALDSKGKCLNDECVAFSKNLK